MTFSIVARDPRSGAFGAATTTGGPCVGMLVPHVASGVGAIATQGDTNPFFGTDGLKFLAEGISPAETLTTLLKADEYKEGRQCLIIGTGGAPAAYTGTRTTDAASHIIGETYAVGGNMLSNENVVKAVADAFEQHVTYADLADAMLAALKAGEAAGGDMRGIKSAALKVYTDQSYPQIDIRVDYAEKPLEKLAELLRFFREGGHADFMATRPQR